MSTNADLAITGVTGALGGLVARAVADLRPRVIARDPARAPDLGGGVETCTYADAAAAGKALTGVRTLFMVSASETADRRDQHRTFIEAAATAGVENIVYTSLLGAAADATFTLARDHHDAEEAIKGSGMAYTLLRNALYADIAPYLFGEDGVLRGPAGNGRVALVARSDIAAVAEVVLRDPSVHADATYTPTGPEALTLSEVAQRVGAALQRDLRFEDERVEDAYAWRREAYGAEQWQLDAWVSTYTAVADGSMATTTDDVQRLTGHPARSLEDVLAG